MASQEASPASAPSAQVVGNVFVGQYYHILHHSPELVHRFYQDLSLLSRPDMDGEMTTVSTMTAINDKILSMNYGDYTAEIISADAQESFEKGVIVLVTGCLTGKDKLRRKFTQTFFLAPQEKGYYVLNDVFRYVDEIASIQSNTSTGEDITENPLVPNLKPEPVPEPTNVPNDIVDPTTAFEEEDLNNGPEVCNPSDNEGSVIDEEAVEPHIRSNEREITGTEDSTLSIHGDATKKSYAFIVKAPKTVTSPVYVVANPVRAAPANTDNLSYGSAKLASAPDTSAPISDIAFENSNHEEGINSNHEEEGHSIYVRNLPFDATAEQLEEEFKKFGPIKRDGIQVRSNKGFCFGFVEFEQFTSVQSALEASPIVIGDRHAVVEEKRTTTRVNNGSRGRYSSGRGGFRGDSFRSRGNYGGGRGGYVRNEFRNQGEFSGRPRGPAPRNEEGYQRGNQNRGGRQAGLTGTPFDHE